MTNIETILRPRVGKLDPSLRKAGAWWIGTDAARDRIAEYDRQNDEWKAAVADLARAYDCDPDMVWLSRVWGSEILTGFTPNDPDNLAPGLRLEQGRRDKAVPSRRSKVGKHLDDEIRRLRKPTKLAVIGGVSGSVDVDSGRNDGSFYSHHGQVIVPDEATHPVLILPVGPNENTRRGPFKVDDNLWERMPLSILHTLIETQEAENNDH